MKNCTNNLALLLVCSSFFLLIVGFNNSAYAEKKITKTEQQATPNKIYGKVTDVIDASGYTYVEVDTGQKKYWAAGPVTSLKKGDMISFPTGMPMKNFHSDSMKRDFPIIYFVNMFATDKEAITSKAGEAASPHSEIKQKQVVNPGKGINKIEGGKSIAEIHASKDSLNGKTIKVRGKVTKFNANILGKNWLHIMDSSTLDDITVTTNSMAAIGDVVIVEGKVELDKDFGYGYVYPIILEDATITKEKDLLTVKK